jgi:2-amino-4-hydroxy-6-hydroxymethyldihydropteridine diphosphokinase
MVVRAFVGLGSNLDHPRRRLAHAVRSLARLPATRVLRVSPNYVSAPLGTTVTQPDYINAVAEISTALAPQALLARLHAIERSAGRERTRGGARNLPRPLDLDLLLYGARRIRLPQLTVPHPRMHERAFVLRPLVDVAPYVTIPHRGLARSLLRSLADQRIGRTRTHRLQ